MPQLKIHCPLRTLAPYYGGPLFQVTWTHSAGLTASGPMNHWPVKTQATRCSSNRPPARPGYCPATLRRAAHARPPVRRLSRSVALQGTSFFQVIIQTRYENEKDKSLLATASSSRGRKLFLSLFSTCGPGTNLTLSLLRRLAATDLQAVVPGQPPSAD